MKTVKICTYFYMLRLKDFEMSERRRLKKSLLRSLMRQFLFGGTFL